MALFEQSSSSSAREKTMGLQVSSSRYPGPILMIFLLFCSWSSCQAICNGKLGRDEHGFLTFLETSIGARPVSNVSVRTVSDTSVNVSFTRPVEAWKSKTMPRHIKVALTYGCDDQADGDIELKAPVNSSSIIVDDILPGKLFCINVIPMQLHGSPAKITEGCLHPLVNHTLVISTTEPPCLPQLDGGPENCTSQDSNASASNATPSPSPVFPAPISSTSSVFIASPSPIATEMRNTTGTEVTAMPAAEGYSLVTVLVSALVPGFIVFVLIVAQYRTYQKRSMPGSVQMPVQTVAYDKFSVACSDVGNLTHLDLGFSRATGIASSRYLSGRAVTVYICYAHHLPDCNLNEQHQQRVLKLAEALTEAGIYAALPCYDVHRVMFNIESWFQEQTHQAVDAIIVVPSAKLVKMWRKVGRQDGAVLDDASSQLAFYESNFVKKLTSDPDCNIPVIPVILERSSSNKTILDFMQRKMPTPTRPVHCYEASGCTELQQYMKDLTRKLCAAGSVQECKVMLELSDSERPGSDPDKDDFTEVFEESDNDRGSQPDRPMPSSDAPSDSGLILGMQHLSSAAGQISSPTTQSTLSCCSANGHRLPKECPESDENADPCVDCGGGGDIHVHVPTTTDLEATGSPQAKSNQSVGVVESFDGCTPQLQDHQVPIPGNCEDEENMNTLVEEYTGIAFSDTTDQGSDNELEERVREALEGFTADPVCYGDAECSGYDLLQEHIAAAMCDADDAGTLQPNADSSESGIAMPGTGSTLSNSGVSVPPHITIEIPSDADSTAQLQGSTPNLHGKCTPQACHNITAANCLDDTTGLPSHSPDYPSPVCHSTAPSLLLGRAKAQSLLAAAFLGNAFHSEPTSSPANSEQGLEDVLHSSRSMYPNHRPDALPQHRAIDSETAGASAVQLTADVSVEMQGMLQEISTPHTDSECNRSHQPASSPAGNGEASPLPSCTMTLQHDCHEKGSPNRNNKFPSPAFLSWLSSTVSHGH
eukprot:scpid28036/ scgid1091/ 